MRTIKLTDEQAKFLEGILERELDAEFVNPADDRGDLYNKTLEIYKAVQPKPRNFIEALVIRDILNERNKELEELRK